MGALNRARSPGVQSTVRLAIHSPRKVAARKSRVTGDTYIAWCLAAVSLPVLAGYLFDIARAYGTAVLIAADANVAGMEWR